MNYDDPCRHFESALTYLFNYYRLRSESLCRYCPVMSEKLYGFVFR
jgi:hypothetical protein